MQAAAVRAMSKLQGTKSRCKTSPLAPSRCTGLRCHGLQAQQAEQTNKEPGAAPTVQVTFDCSQQGSLPPVFTVTAAEPQPACSAAEVPCFHISVDAHSPAQGPVQLSAAAPAVRHDSSGGAPAPTGLQQSSPDPLKPSGVSANLLEQKQDPAAGSVRGGTRQGRSKPSRNSRRAHKKLTKSAGDGSDDCIVCWSAPASIIMMPCGHCCCCLTCAQPFLTAGVPRPMCRSAVENGIAVEGSCAC